MSELPAYPGNRPDPGQRKVTTHDAPTRMRISATGRPKSVSLATLGPIYAIFTSSRSKWSSLPASGWLASIWMLSSFESVTRTGNFWPSWVCISS